MKTNELIELQRSIATGNYQMGLSQEWKVVGIRDPDGIESVIALCHPNNARAIALVPELIAEVIRLREALGTVSELLDCGNIEQSHWDDALDTARSALANDK